MVILLEDNEHILMLTKKRLIKKNYKLKNPFKNCTDFNSFKYEKNIFYSRKILKYKFYGNRRNFFIRFKNRSFFRLNIQVSANNVFFSLSNNRSRKVILSKNTGSLGMKVSKKGLKYLSVTALDNFLNLLDKSLYKNVYIYISAPIRIRKKLLRALSLFFKNTSL